LIGSGRLLFCFFVSFVSFCKIPHEKISTEGNKGNEEGAEAVQLTGFHLDRLSPPFLLFLRFLRFLL